ncbi:hypothetical protein MSMTP_1539 [Methanosarcina sp. MTP4]|uniref:hypothetical protein n=1 Tax=Methanosarcina sp. MTP4 TaxID=1434100 RepID=UPI000615BD44|nr:hypothetical protein [Methanosarcina sp. MTP4]AKB25008.1 hypothetical protein MSMTP_1539 [Methanosarcina sp. MTP4]
MMKNREVTDKIELIKSYVNSNSGKWVESPRNKAFGENKRQKYQLFQKTPGDKILFKLESGNPLYIEIWRFEEAVTFLDASKGPVKIGAKISENYPGISLEDHLKKIAKSKYDRSSDVKTAPHIADLLVLADIAEFKRIIPAKGRKVHGVKLKGV